MFATVHVVAQTVIIIDIPLPISAMQVITVQFLNVLQVKAVQQVQPNVEQADDGHSGSILAYSLMYAQGPQRWAAASLHNPMHIELPGFP